METIKNRTLGSSGLSIGTHLTIESLFYNKFELYDKDRDFNKINIKDYDYHVFNLFTIVRNILNSYLEKDKRKLITNKKFNNVLIEEITLLNNAFYGSNCNPLLFYPKYDRVYKNYGLNKPKLENEPFILHLLIENYLSKVEKDIGIVSCNRAGSYKLPNLKGKGLITTHIPADLFNKGNFSLLESHTGKLKTKSSYNSKYHNIGKADLKHLPWMEELLYILGDKVFIASMPIGIRKELYDISIKYNWTIKSEKNKILGNLLRYPEIYSMFKDFKPCYEN